MRKPTLCVSIDSRESTNPIQLALNQVMKALGCDLMPEVVQGELEADIAVVNSLAVALKMVKQTEKTTIILTHFSKSDGEGFAEFASRSSGRVVALPYVSAKEGDPELMPFLIDLANQKIKEMQNADSSA